MNITEDTQFFLLFVFSFVLLYTTMPCSVQKITDNNKRSIDWLKLVLLSLFISASLTIMLAVFQFSVKEQEICKIQKTNFSFIH